MEDGGRIRMRRSHVGEIKDRIMRQNLLHAVYFQSVYLIAENDMFFAILPNFKRGICFSAACCGRPQRR